MDDGWRKVEAGECGVWPLPADATCARVARRLFRRVAGALAVDAEAVDDGETMVSELAANTLHARGTCNDERDRHDKRDQSELWLYLRGSGEQRELVCKVFDAHPGWARGGAPGQGGRRVPADSTGGRGLEVVREMSRGRWGYHLTRARLGGRRLRGKAVWFATPAPLPHPGPAASPLLVPQGGRGGQRGRRGQRGRGEQRGASLAGPPIPATVAMTRLEAELAARGFGETMARADESAKDTAVLSVCGDLTVWCREGLAWLRAPGLDGQAWGYADLVEVAEQAVEAHETLCAEPDAGTASSGQTEYPAAARALGGVPAQGAYPIVSATAW